MSSSSFSKSSPNRGILWLTCKAAAHCLRCGFQLFVGSEVAHAHVRPVAVARQTIRQGAAMRAGHMDRRRWRVAQNESIFTVVYRPIRDLSLIGSFKSIYKTKSLNRPPHTQLMIVIPFFFFLSVKREKSEIP
jgi:hypothetical protein